MRFMMFMIPRVYQSDVQKAADNPTVRSQLEQRKGGS